MADKADNRGDDDSRSGDSDREQAPRQVVIPDAVDHFLGKLKDSLETRNIPDINKLYEDDFNKLSEKHYGRPKNKHEDGRWPSVEAVRDQISDPLCFSSFTRSCTTGTYIRASSPPSRTAEVPGRTT